MLKTPRKWFASRALAASAVMLAVALPLRADTMYIFAGERAPDAGRGVGIHRFAFDSEKPEVVTPAPSAGQTGSYWGEGAGKPFAGKRITGIAVGKDGNVYAVCPDTGSVLRFDGQTGAFLGTVFEGLTAPDGITAGPDGNLYITSDTAIVRCGLDGKPKPGSEQIGATFASGGWMKAASGITFGPDGNLYVASQANAVVLRYDGQTGQFIDVFSAGHIHAPSQISFGEDGNLYVANTAGAKFDRDNGEVIKLDGKTGSFLGVLAPEARGALSVSFGPKNDLFVSDYWNSQITRYDAKTGKSLGAVVPTSPGNSLYYLTLAKQAKTGGANNAGGANAGSGANAAGANRLVAWNVDVPAVPASERKSAALAGGPETVKGWENALKPVGTPGPSLTLAAHKKTDYVISIPADASPKDEKAASVMAYALWQMTGATFPIVREGQPLPMIVKTVAANKATGGANNTRAAARTKAAPAKATAPAKTATTIRVPASVISIGRTKLFQNSGLSAVKLDLKDEGYAVAAKGTTLFLVGGQLRGPLYAVYSFLEEDLGCRWYAPEATRIPRRSNLTFKPVLRHFVPILEIRDPYYAEAFNPDWSLRNRTDSTAVPVSEEFGGYQRPAIFVHSYNALVPPDKYFKEHPEYFSEINGERKPLQLCLSNPDVLRIATESVKRYLRDTPGSKFISVSPNDGRGYCECPLCRAVDEAEATVPGSKSGTLMKFVNQVAEAIEPEFPGVKISTLAYLDTYMPPKTLRPRRNVVIQLCTDVHAWRYQFDYVTESKEFQTAMKAWDDIDADIYIWDYTTSYVHFMVPMPNMPVVTPNIRFYLDHGAKGIMLQGTYNSPGGENAMMRSWVWAKQLWDPSRDTRALMKDFIYGYYGTAAEPIWQYNQMLWNIWEKDHAIPHTPGVTKPGEHPLIVPAPCSMPPDWEVLDANYLRQTNAWMDEAESLAKDPQTQLRVKIAKLPLLYVELGQGLGYIEEFGDFKAGNWTKNPDPDQKAHYVALLKEFEEIAGQAAVTHIGELRTLDLLTTKWHEVLEQDFSKVTAIPLNTTWKFQTDPDKTGDEKGWAAAGLDETGWVDQQSDKNTGWESQGFADYKGQTWYRQKITVPAELKDWKYLYLFFKSVDSESVIYINGVKAFDHTLASTGMTAEQIWNAPFAFDPRPFLKFGEENTIVVKVSSGGGVRGVYRPAYLIANNLELNTAQMKSAVLRFG